MSAAGFQGNFILVLSSSLQLNFSSILVQFRYDFGLKVHLITYIGLHFLGFSWSKAQRKGMDSGVPIYTTGDQMSF